MERNHGAALMTLALPPEEKWALAARMALSGAGALLGMGVDGLSDLRMAADEAIDLLLHQPRRAEALRVSLEGTGGGVRLLFDCALSREAQPCEPPDLDIARGILETICAAVTLLREDDCVRAVTLEMPIV